jgi:hypothetical protein
MHPALLLILLVLSFATTTAAQVRRPAPTPATSEGGVIRPRLADSATGYIDNAIIGSQVRIRLDAGFGVNAPDRAEFFYAKCGCFRFLPITNPAYDPNAPGPGSGGQIEGDLAFQEFRFDAEYALAHRFSILAEVPARTIEPRAVPRTAGLGDIEIGAKGGIIANDTTALTGQMRVYFPSGDARKGLGTNHTTIEPSLLYHSRLGDSGFSIAGETAIWIPIRGSAGVPTASGEKFSGNVFRYGVGGSYAFVDTSRIRVTPVVELIGWRVFNGFQTTPAGSFKANGTDIVNVKVGARVDSGGPSSFYLGVGHALTDAVWYQDIVRAEYRFAF